MIQGGAGMDEILAGRAVVVTGAGRGLGRGFADAAAAAGAQVVVNDVDREVAETAAAEIRSSGAAAVADHSDISSWDGAAALIDRCVGAFGGIDGLVNNAGVFYTCSPLQETESGLRRIVETNVLGTQFCGVHAIRAMAQSGGGTIVNIGSEGMQGYAMMGAYAATKGAVASLTYAWAHHIDETHVRVNAVLPNAQTRMSPVDADGTPLPRPDPATVAPVVVYLLSDLSHALNGKLLKFNGTTLASMLPAALAPDQPYRDEGWTVVEIAAACDGELADSLHRAAGPSAHDAGVLR
jgi:NAD(P)-dependent dehydrogenase (short-subunit alcohol dehydrogenase family)